MSQARDLVDSLVDTTNQVELFKCNVHSTTSTTNCSALILTVVTHLTVNITPTATSSIIKIEAMVSGEWGKKCPLRQWYLVFLQRYYKFSCTD